jgi:hypothetical protein
MDTHRSVDIAETSFSGTGRARGRTLQKLIVAG